MFNGSAGQNPAIPASQARRFSRNARGSTARVSNHRQPSIRRISSTRDSTDPFDLHYWTDIKDFNIDDENQLGAEIDLDTAFQGQEDDFEGFLNSNTGSGGAPAYPSEQHAYANFFENFNVALPGTPHSISFPGFNQQIDNSSGYQVQSVPPTLQHVNNQQMDIPSGRQSQSVPQTPSHINNQIMVPVTIHGETVLVAVSQGQINAALNAQASVSRAVPLTMSTDGKRSSVPKSPARQHRGSQSGMQIQYEDPLIGGSEYLDPTLLHSNNTAYPEPTAYYGNSLNQPYFQNSYQQGVPSPGDRSNQGLRFNHPVSSYEQQNRTSKVRDSYEALFFPEIDIDMSQFPATRTRSSSVSTYPSRNSSSGNSHLNSLGRHKRNRHVNSRAPLDKRVSVFAGEGNDQYQKPKIADFNPEVRINKTTKGLTTRTGKINMYDPRRHYTYTMHPLGTPEQPEGADWEGRRFGHKYNDASTRDQNSGEKTITIYEFEDRAMPAAKIRDFILSYPNERNKLTLRIQVAPGDSGRRYKKGADKCRFAECPARNGGQNRTIKHGFYRVAFDERNDDEYDPFAACCGFAHLYCMERFLDFEYICRKANVVVDTRVQLRGEPNGKFAAALEGKQAEAAETAVNFILAAKSKSQVTRRERNDVLGVRRLKMFEGYPRQDPQQYSNEEAWDAEYPYEHTLGYHMTRLTESHRAYAQLIQFAGGAGGLGPTKISVHRGDLGLFAEAYTRAKEAKEENSSSSKGKKKSKRYVKVNVHQHNDLFSKRSNRYVKGNVHQQNDLFSQEVQRRVDRAKRVIAEMAESIPQTRRRQNRLASMLESQHQTDALEEFEEQDYPEGREPWASASDDESDADYDRRIRHKGARSSKRITGKQPINYFDDPGDFQEYDPQPRQPLKRKRSENHYQPMNDRSQQMFNNMQQHHSQHAWHSYAGQNDGYGQERSSKRKRSSVPHVDHQQAQSNQDAEWWLQLDADQSVDADDLGLNFDLHYSPSSPGRKRKLSSRSDKQFDDLFDDNSEFARSSKRLRSGTSEATRGHAPRLSVTTSSIMRHPGTRTPSGNNRHASFRKEPVSHQKTFNTDAPPQRVRSRMIKELESTLSDGVRSTKEGESPGRTLRSGRSISSVFE